MKKVLTLTDFSTVADYAIDAAIHIAKQHGTELEIFHLLSSSEHIMYELDSDPEFHIKTGSKMATSASLESWRQKAISLGVKTTFTVAAGSLTKQITERIDSKDVDLIVMGSTGKDESDAVWGTTTQQVTKQIEIPILVIKSKLTNYNFEKIVFASNLELEDQEAFSNFIQLMTPPKSSLIHFMSVNTSSYFTQPRALMISVLKDFQELAKPYKSESTFYHDYSVSSGIRHFLEKTQPDLLVMTDRDIFRGNN